MISKLFDRPVYLKEQKNLVREITAVEAAIDYLEDWPERERDLIHEAALRTCYMAHDGLKPLRAARDAIRSFAKAIISEKSFLPLASAAICLQPGKPVEPVVKILFLTSSLLGGTIQLVVKRIGPWKDSNSSICFHQALP